MHHFSLRGRDFPEQSSSTRNHIASYLFMSAFQSVSSVAVRNYSATVGVRSIVINPSVCLCVCPRAYLWNRWTDRHEILCVDPPWPWLGPPPAALRYVMYFRARRGRQGLAALSVGDQLRARSTGAEYDVYECLFENETL